MSSEETAEPIKMPFWGETRGPIEPCIRLSQASFACDQIWMTTKVDATDYYAL